MSILIVERAFAQGRRDVEQGTERLRAERDRADRVVTGLLGGGAPGAGWSGTAASAYGAGWDDWRVAADEVLAGLVAMGELLAAAHAGLHLGDDASRAVLDQVSARIVERLG